MWPSHIDPTINLHDVFYVVEGDRVVNVWPIEARGYREQRQPD
jgi:D-serine deaminase-like pyridoxal phosphate-dependent protein